MEDLPLGRIAALVPEFAVKDLPLGRILMVMRLLPLGNFKERSVPHKTTNTGGTDRSD